MKLEFIASRPTLVIYVDISKCKDLDFSNITQWHNYYGLRMGQPRALI